MRRVRRRGRAARRRHRSRGHQPARGVRAPDGADHRLLLRRSGSWSRSTASARARGPGASDRGDRRALPSCRSELITRKNAEQIALMRTGGRGRGRDARGLHPRRGRPGATTLDVDAVAARCSTDAGRASNFLGYHGFPAVVCTSPNDVIVHGIPSADVVLAGGRHPLDRLRGDHRGLARRRRGHRPDRRDRRRVDRGSSRSPARSLEAAIEQVVDGHRLGDVGAAVEGIAERAGFSVVREYVGHGIGTAMHEDPRCPTTGRRGAGMKLKEGHVLAIEPMVNAGTAETEVLDDGWTVVTARRPPLRPLRAHHRRHRARPRGPHPAPLSRTAKCPIVETGLRHIAWSVGPRRFLRAFPRARH